MENSWYSFDVAPEWVFVAILLAFGLSVLLYSRNKTPWNRATNLILGFLRFSAIFLILLLLLNPLLQLNVSRTEKPILVVALDNSESIKLRSGTADTASILQWIKSVRPDLDQFEVVNEYLSPPSHDSVAFNAKVTNLGLKLKRITNAYDNHRVAGVLLLSDGIINEGQSPAYQNFPFPVYTVGLGDTLAPKDLAIQNVRSNQVAYQGNQFPVNITLHQKGFDNQSVEVRISEGNQVLATQTQELKTATGQLNFFLNAEKAGLRRLTISVQEKDGESSFVNNHQDLYVDVVAGKDKILILAPAPHPDIRALREALAQTANYETTVYIPGVQPSPKEKQYDLIIEHQAFSDTKYGEFQSSGKLYILGESSHLNLLGKTTNFIKITERGRQRDQVRASYNPAFSKYKLDETRIGRLSGYPPVHVPFGEYELSGPTETLLFQQIGNIITNKPLLVLAEDGSQKTAVITGSGFWQWRIQEIARNENAQLFDELIQKTVQYLCIKVNKDRFVAKPREAGYQSGDRIFIDTEVYNEIYERSYSNRIQLSVSNDQGLTKSYELEDSPVNSSFNLGSLPAGIYQFTASTQAGDQTFTEKGSFAVKEILLESINLTADHNLLRSLAKNTGGAYRTFAHADQLLQTIKQKDTPSLIRTAKETFPLINSLWIILLIAGMLGTEWFLRKYLGAY